MQESLQLTQNELKMFKEVFDVMKKHKVKRKFAIQLIHEHFLLKEGEVLYETHNKQKRVMKITPKPIKDIVPGTLVTAWSITNRGKVQIAMFCCDSVVIRP